MSKFCSLVEKLRVYKCWKFFVLFLSETQWKVYFLHIFNHFIWKLPRPYNHFSSSYGNFCGFPPDYISDELFLIIVAFEISSRIKFSEILLEPRLYSIKYDVLWGNINRMWAINAVFIAPRPPTVNLQAHQLIIISPMFSIIGKVNKTRSSRSTDTKNTRLSRENASRRNIHFERSHSWDCPHIGEHGGWPAWTPSSTPWRRAPTQNT